jgi:hypothetical protein
MNIIQGIEKGDKASIILSTSVLLGVLYGVWQKKGLFKTTLYGAAFGIGGLAINSIFKLK